MVEEGKKKGKEKELDLSTDVVISTDSDSPWQGPMLPGQAVGLSHLFPIITIMLFRPYYYLTHDFQSPTARLTGII